jgi:hypothetical protein
MQEILPGIWHWSALHEKIGERVHSYFVAQAGALIDPMVPEEGIEWFAERPPERILLTIRHHYRHSGRFTEAFGCPVFCNETGLHEFAGGPEVQGYAPGDELAPGIRACEVGVICPDETALHITVGEGALACADGVIRHDDGRLGFVPDWLLGDDPEAIKAGLRASFVRLCEQEAFDTLLMAHGEPLVGGAKAALREFAQTG